MPKSFIRLGPGVNFINILQAAFKQADPKSAKNTDGLTVFFVRLGSGHIKVARIILMKLTPGFQRRKLRVCPKIMPPSFNPYRQKTGWFSIANLSFKRFFYCNLIFHIKPLNCLIVKRRFREVVLTVTMLLFYIITYCYHDHIKLFSYQILMQGSG